MKYFVKKTSIVREIWSKTDTVLFIFIGSAAEFALNKAVDWLYFTGKLPGDPLGRLLSTVVYARKVIFQEEESALQAIKSITQIHKNVEKARKASIPEWAYRDVLYMLIYYSIAAFELLERKLSIEEKEEIFDVFFRVGKGMELTNLPHNYADWLVSRSEHLRDDLTYSALTEDLFKRYKYHLGSVRFYMLWQAQKLLVPKQVYELLKFSKSVYFKILVDVYKSVKNRRLVKEIKYRLLPVKYRATLRAIEYV